MLLRRLTLTNYGLYAGTATLDLAPRVLRGSTRPVVLFGGKNGAGKTTILESIRLALYGRIALGPRVSLEEYHDFLRGRVHRGGLDGPRPSDAAVSIEFDHVERGACNRYVVERSWALSGSGRVAERLAVMKNDKPVDEVDADLWQGFVRDIIPEGLSQLFFFDGEKIRELAEDATGSRALADAVKSLLGLDMVERLQADLEVYAVRQAATLGSETDRETSDRLEREIGACDREVSKAQQQLAALRTRTDGLHAEVRRAEDALRRDGKDLAGRRERLAAERESLVGKAVMAEKAIREQCDHFFPLSLCPSTSKLLSAQLKAEAATLESARVQQKLAEVRKTLQRRLKGLTQGKNSLSAAALKRTTGLVLEVLEAHEPPTKTDQLHGFSEVEARRCLAALQAASKEAGPTVVARCKDLTRWSSRIEAIDRALAQVPADDALAPKVKTLNDLNQRLGSLQQKQADVEERKRRAELDGDQRRRELRRLTEEIGKSDKSSGRLKLARSAQAALVEYLHELTGMKLAQLRTSVAMCFNRLARKGELISSVEIDPATFAVKIIDRAGVAIPKDELSSGEKQIFAIALLWALATTSGRPLPVIIDTPLGRLDSDHRLKLVHDYLPMASHQVIVLSTDTEVDEPLFEAIRPHVSHAYRLTYLPDDRRTRLETGYFWGSRKEQACPT